MTEAQVGAQTDDSHGLVLVGHGSHAAPESSQPIHDHVDRLRAEEAFDEVKAAFWQGEPHIREVIRTVACDRITIVPMMMASGYFTADVFPRELRLNPNQSLATAKTVRYMPPVGTHPALADVIERRAKAAAENSADGLAVVGHGTTRHEESGTSTYDHVARLRSDGQFSEVKPFFLDEEPIVNSLTSEMDASEIVIVPLFVADGSHTTEDVPRAIGLPADPAGPTMVDGKRLWYTDAVGTAPSLSKVILDRATEDTAMIVKDASSEIHAEADSPTEVFGQWLEAPVIGQTGHRTWGEVRITVNVSGDAKGGYSVRHLSDAATPAENLERLSDVSDIRETVRYDDSGQFRPLLSARTLQNGWIVQDPSLIDLVRVLDIIYPASVTNWYREREDRLDVTDFGAVTGRHSGRFAELEDVSAAVRERTVATVCGDCVRCPVWGPQDDGEGVTEIPCREPCSFVLDAMLHFRELESDIEPIDVEPSVQPGHFDRAGNQYHTRYLQFRDREEDPLVRGEP